MIIDQDGNELRSSEPKPTAGDWFIAVIALALVVCLFIAFFTDFLPAVLG